MPKRFLQLIKKRLLKQHEEDTSFTRLRRRLLRRQREKDKKPIPIALALIQEESVEPPSELEFVIEHMQQGLWRISAFGLITYANPYLADWLGVNPLEMVGQHYSKFRRLGIVDGSRVDEGLSQRYEAEFVASNGEIKRAIVVTSPIANQRNEVVGTVDIITDVTAERAAHTELTRKALTDVLTGVANRRAFEEELERLPADQPFGLLLIDADRFKDLNDRYGHAAGDEALIEIARRIQHSVRAGDLVARLGGDEFVALLPGIDRPEMEQVARRVAAHLVFNLSENYGSAPVSASVGGAFHEGRDGDPLHAADEAMYRMKEARKQAAA
jgi:diguanylate cyclase (GGDEF)-like protein/PAS domain S-box-containing protein